MNAALFFPLVSFFTSRSDGATQQNAQIDANRAFLLFSAVVLNLASFPGMNKAGKPLSLPALFSGDEEDRTLDLTDANRTLS